MNKIYIDYENGQRKYYAYKYANDKITYIPLNGLEIDRILESILYEPITSLVDDQNSKEIVFKNSISLIVDKLNALYPAKDKQDKYFAILLERIREYVTNINLSNYQKRLPAGYIPKVNRKPKNKFPTKRVISGALSFIVATSLIANLYNKEISKDNIISNSNIIVTEEMPKKEIQQEKSVKEASIDVAEIPTCTINLAFQDRTESNRVSTDMSKLDETNHYFGSYIEKYANLFGLPSDIASAQITQERPNIKNGTCENVCQITYEYFVGQTMTIPIYDASGFTGEYETFTVTKEMLDTPEGNIKVGIAFLRNCVDKFDSLILGLFIYNQGGATLSNACNYYGLDINDYLGDENAIKARDLINRYYEEKDKSHGDNEYLEHVFSYLKTSDRGSINLKYYMGSELRTLEINNTLEYNNELSR